MINETEWFRFEDQAAASAAVAALSNWVVERIDSGEDLDNPPLLSIDAVGSIVEQGTRTGTDIDGAPVFAPSTTLPGWHVNLRRSDVVDLTATWEAVRIERPSSPIRDFA